MCEPSACPPGAPESRTREASPSIRLRPGGDTAWRSAERLGERHGDSGSGVRSPGCQLRRPDIHLTCSASRRTKASLSTRIRGRTRSRPHECASARLILLYGRPGLLRIQRRRQVPARSRTSISSSAMRSSDIHCSSANILPTATCARWRRPSERGGSGASSRWIGSKFPRRRKPSDLRPLLDALHPLAPSPGRVRAPSDG